MRDPKSLAVLLLVSVAAGTALAAAPAGESAEKRVDRAWRARENKAERAEAIRLCEGLVGDAKVQPSLRSRAFEIWIDALRRDEKWDDAVAVSERWRKAFPDDKELQVRAYYTESDLLRQAKKDPEAVERLRALIRALPDDKAVVVDAHLRIAGIFLEGRRYAECRDEAEKAMQADPENAKAAAGALWLQADAAYRTEDWEGAVALLKRLMENPAWKETDFWRRRDARFRYGDCLDRLKKFADEQAHYEAAEKAEPDPKQAQEYCLRAADAALKAERPDDALRACERVFVAHPEASDHWYAAQRTIADLHLKRGRFDEALQAARILLDAASDEGRVAEAARFLAEALKGLDRNVARANAVLNYQRFGPDGEDAKPGTPDDLKDPLAAMPRPTWPDRERAFDEARKKAGDDADAMRHRAMTYLHSGHPKEALRCFVDAFGRSTQRDFQNLGREMICVGARAVRGHAVGLDPFFAFVNCGPAGPDGKPGTADDLKDPFEPLLK